MNIGLFSLSKKTPAAVLLSFLNQLFTIYICFDIL
jgi:hypothetical protein